MNSFVLKYFGNWIILQILAWEFCARRHEELLPRRLVAPQVLFYIFFVSHIAQIYANKFLN